MINILSGEWYKIRKEKTFYVCLMSVAILVGLLYFTLFMVDEIRNQQPAEGGTGIYVYSEEELSEGPYIYQVGIMGVLQQMLNGHFTVFIMAVIASIFVIKEYTDGAVKNIVGKGYSRASVFLSKLLITELAAMVILGVTFVCCILAGGLLMGKEGLQAMNWRETAAYMGMQIIISMSVTGIAVLVGELTRSLAAGISISTGIIIFSTSLLAGADTLLSVFSIQPSRYWPLSLQMECPVSGLEQEFVMRGIGASLAWLFLAVFLGIFHFQKADVT